MDMDVTTPERIKLIAKNFAVRLAQATLASKIDIANFVKKTDFDDRLRNLNTKIIPDHTKHFLVENKLIIGQSYFNNNGSQNYLIFQ